MNPGRYTSTSPQMEPHCLRAHLNGQTMLRVSYNTTEVNHQLSISVIARFPAMMWYDLVQRRTGEFSLILMTHVCNVLFFLNYPPLLYISSTCTRIQGSDLQQRPAWRWFVQFCISGGSCLHIPAATQARSDDHWE